MKYIHNFTKSLNLKDYDDGEQFQKDFKTAFCPTTKQLMVLKPAFHGIDTHIFIPCNKGTTSCIAIIISFLYGISQNMLIEENKKEDYKKNKTFKILILRPKNVKLSTVKKKLKNYMNHQIESYMGNIDSSQRIEDVKELKESSAVLITTYYNAMELMKENWIEFSSYQLIILQDYIETFSKALPTIRNVTCKLVKEKRKFGDDFPQLLFFSTEIISNFVINQLPSIHGSFPSIQNTLYEDPFLSLNKLTIEKYSKIIIIPMNDWTQYKLFKEEIGKLKNYFQLEKKIKGNFEIDEIFKFLNNSQSHKSIVDQLLSVLDEIEKKFEFLPFQFIVKELESLLKSSNLLELHRNIYEIYRQKINSPHTNNELYRFPHMLLENLWKLFYKIIIISPNQSISIHLDISPDVYPIILKMIMNDRRLNRYLKIFNYKCSSIDYVIDCKDHGRIKIILIGTIQTVVETIIREDKMKESLVLNDKFDRNELSKISSFYNEHFNNFQQFIQILNRNNLNYELIKNNTRNFLKYDNQIIPSFFDVDEAIKLMRNYHIHCRCCDRFICRADQLCQFGVLKVYNYSNIKEKCPSCHSFIAIVKEERNEKHFIIKCNFIMFHSLEPKKKFLLKKWKEFPHTLPELIFL
ncbi:hypothetical protein SNEBB_006704 [Seison nebaliae]|nr:hypothetical protein SNEBB_006704 [Seison nebaliae]